MRRTSWVAAATLGGLGAFVIYSSLTLGGVRCEVCVEFRGRERCRAVDGPTEDEARRAAQTNACAGLASGVTDSMACERTTPRSLHCTERR